MGFAGSQPSSFHAHPTTAALRGGFRFCALNAAPGVCVVGPRCPLRQEHRAYHACEIFSRLNMPSAPRSRFARSLCAPFAVRQARWRFRRPHGPEDASPPDCSFIVVWTLGRMLVGPIFGCGGSKGALPHGEFGAMCDSDLPFSANTAQRLMSVASDGRLANPAHGQLLPSSWRTLYELTKLDD